MPVKPIPAGFRTVTSYFVVRGVNKLMPFLADAFGAKERTRTAGPDGTIMHAQMKIGNSIVMMGEAPPQFPPMPCSIYLYVRDTDATYKKAMAAGGTSLMEPADQFYGDRNAGILDLCGNQWWIATHIEDVPESELAERAKKQLR